MDNSRRDFLKVCGVVIAAPSMLLGLKTAENRLISAAEPVLKPENGMILPEIRLLQPGSSMCHEGFPHGNFGMIRRWRHEKTVADLGTQVEMKIIDCYPKIVFTSKRGNAEIWIRGACSEDVLEFAKTQQRTQLAPPFAFYGPEFLVEVAGERATYFAGGRGSRKNFKFATEVEGCERMTIASRHCVHKTYHFFMPIVEQLRYRHGYPPCACGDCTSHNYQIAKPRSDRQRELLANLFA